MSTGVSASTSSASGGLTQNRSPSTITILKRSKSSVISPDVKSSLRFSTSFVTRVTSAPVGCLSNQARSSS